MRAGWPHASLLPVLWKSTTYASCCIHLPSPSSANSPRLEACNAFRNEYVTLAMVSFSWKISNRIVPGEMDRIAHANTRTMRVRSTYSNTPQNDVFLQFRQSAKSTTLKSEQYV